MQEKAKKSTPKGAFLGLIASAPRIASTSLIALRGGRGKNCSTFDLRSSSKC